LEDKLEQLAFTIVGEASGLLRDWFYENGFEAVVGRGASGDDTRLVDQLIENYIIDRLKASGHELLIVSEERGLIKTSGLPKYIVLLDPLDGSLNYVAKIPLVAVSLALYRVEAPFMNRAVAGAVSNVFSREIYSFDSEKVYINGREVCKPSPKFQGLISVYTEDPSLLEFLRDVAVKEFSVKPKFRTLGCASLEAVYAALGRVDLFINNTGRLRNFDIACGIAIANRLGVHATSLTGEPTAHRVDGVVFIDSIIIGLYAPKFLEAYFRKIHAQ